MENADTSHGHCCFDFSNLLTNAEKSDGETQLLGPQAYEALFSRGLKPREITGTGHLLL